MTMRAVRDAAGVEWQVWEVHPSASGPSASGPSASGPSASDAERDPGARRPALTPGLESGWLACQSATGERRRVVPIPDGWHALDDERLRALLATADAQPNTHRRLIE